jgi:CheY-like chemotaxis protein
MSLPYALIVEPEAATAERLASVLARLGYRAEVTETWREAQVRLLFTTPDLLVLDAHLPHQTGPVLLRQVRGQPRFGDTCVVLLASGSQPSAEQRLEADQVLVKPLTEDQLSELAVCLKQHALKTVR